MAKVVDLVFPIVKKWVKKIDGSKCDMHVTTKIVYSFWEKKHNFIIIRKKTENSEFHLVWDGNQFTKWAFLDNWYFSAFPILWLTKHEISAQVHFFGLISLYQACPRVCFLFLSYFHFLGWCWPKTINSSYWETHSNSSLPFERLINIFMIHLEANKSHTKKRNTP